ncbi:cell surface protein [Polaribacter aestuariivivens]|uniref:Cell surface protein n=1 Tax=Polaribacter aestuariivivens TaxID=2304626 RepID=A0A5S3NDD9_9FLAO|nr:cell surface protein [Polaribacter aestuariivivens]TMM31076.1 cell surface protein [Polaribacter aestuariivivens]
MKYIQLILLFVTFSLAISCNNKTDNKITNPKDYNAYLNIDKNISLNNSLSEYSFWENKLIETPNQYPYNAKLATANSTIFQLTGNIKALKEAEQNLIIANEKVNYTNAGYLRSLARNYISQHRFKEALSLLKKAEENGEKLQLTQFMLIDVNLELGNLQAVENYLTEVKNFKSFDYLIRLSKYNDHLGNLDKAIQYLEASLEIAKSSKNESLLQWNYTNLADYYGHAGRIQDSYNAYLKSLELNPNDSYAKKGIAWIVYSYERNPEEALRILDAVTKENAAPDYHLLKAEIAEFTRNTEVKNKQIDLYLAKVKDTNYGVMYHKYDVLLYAEDASKFQKALEIAQQEVNERPTAQSYDLLAWSLYKSGEKEKALKISENHVINKTFEPEAMLHTAYILKANGRVEEASEIKKELLGAVYELGPLVEKELKSI